jgi:hypothetical protein
MALYCVMYEFVFEDNAFDTRASRFELLKGLNWTVAS